jgi:hypothetical protein
MFLSLFLLLCGIQVLVLLLCFHDFCCCLLYQNRILGEIKDQIEQVLSVGFENYKSLDESSLSGIMDVFKPATGLAAPALEPAVKLYTLLHDILSPEAQTNLTHYFQVQTIENFHVMTFL